MVASPLLVAACRREKDLTICNLWEQLTSAAYCKTFCRNAARIKARENVTVHAAVHLDVTKTTQAAAKRKLASMRNTSHLITALQLYSQLVLHFVTGLFCVTDVAHSRNAAPGFDYSQADKLYNDRFASSPPLQVITALV